MKLTRTTAAALATGLLALTAAGCGSESTKPGAADQAISASTPDTTASTAAEATTSTPATPAATGKGGGAVLPISTDMKKKPAVPKPKGDPPSELIVKDIVKGTGKTATKGSEITVKYVGVSWSTGEQFDASWDRGEDFPFTLGGGNVIAGWDEGVEGMKVGGRRELVIPADKAYGAQGSPPSIAPNATLVFVIDLVKA
jgi:peptidylprolyl isomerase